MRQAIRTKYHGPTNARGSRISASCEAKTIYVPYDHELGIDGNHNAAATALVVQMGWNGPGYGPMCGGSFKGDRYWVFEPEFPEDRIDVRKDSTR